MLTANTTNDQLNKKISDFASQHTCFCPECMLFPLKECLYFISMLK